MAKTFKYIPNRIIDADGISDGASVYFYRTGGTTLIDIFSDEALTVPLANPYVVAAGAAVPYIYYDEDENIRVRIVESNGTVVSDEDPYYDISNLLPKHVDSYDSLQDAIDALSPGEALNFGDGTHVIDTPLDGTALSNNLLFGSATIQASSTNVGVWLLDLQGTTDVTLDGLTFDANKANRGSLTTTTTGLGCVTASTSTRFITRNCTFKNALGYTNSVPEAKSWVALVVSGNADSPIVEDCNFFDNGTSATVKPCDGVFMRANYGKIVNCKAENCTDHGFVLEGSNYSIISNCQGESCTSVAAISNDTNTDCVGNIIENVSGSCSFFGSGGAIVGIYAGLGGATGAITGTTLRDVFVAPAVGATGGGPAFAFQGELEVVAENLEFDGGSSTAVTHGVLASGLSGKLLIKNSRFRMPSTATSSVRVNAATTGLAIHDCKMSGGTFGIAVDGSSSIETKTNSYSGHSDSAAYVDTANSKVVELGPVSIAHFGAVDSTTADSTAAIQAAEQYCLTVGAALHFPIGNFRCDSTINKRTNVNWYGAGKEATVLDYRGNATFINAVGSSGSRIICTMKDMKWTGENSGAASVGIQSGWNQRCTLLDNVEIYQFGKYGIQFTDQNWIVTFREVIVNQCGWDTANGAGIYKAGNATGPGEWNDIKFIACNIEVCGRAADSTGGGILIANDVANRGLQLIGCDVEGCFGTSQIYISNMDDVNCVGLYMESVGAAVNAATFEGSNVIMTGGYIRGADAGVNLRGVRTMVGAGNIEERLTVSGTHFSGFGTSIASEAGCIVRTLSMGGERTFANLSASPAQWIGEYEPRVSAHKNSVAQTVPTATFTKVTFGTERYDRTSAYASSTFTPGTIGTYKVDAQVTFPAPVANMGVILCIYVNGVSRAENVTVLPTTDQQSVAISALIDIAASTDTIEIYARHVAGVDKDISGDPTKTWFMANYIGPTTA